MRLLDLFAGAGGCSVGYARAGFDVVGVDRLPHDDYPFELVVCDALAFLGYADLDRFDLVVASPPCLRWSPSTGHSTRLGYRNLLSPVRQKLLAWGGPYIIENVPQAPLVNPIRLCGSSFGLPVRRHRHFESNLPLTGLPCRHGKAKAIGVYGDHPDPPGGVRRPNGASRGTKAASVLEAQAALGIDWMTRWDDLADAIPPAYTQHLGLQAAALLKRRAA